MSNAPGSAATRPQTAETADAARPMIPVYAMALGTFAIGTEGFMIAPLLPRMAEDFGQPLSAVAMLVTAFTLTLSLSSPVLTVFSAGLNRRWVLIAAMTAFALANILAWSSTSFTGILTARILLAAAAGLYTPNANALAGAIVAPERRGRALAIVSGGMTLAIALGLPAGSLVGHAFGWRATFLAVGAMAAVAAAGIALAVDRQAGSGMHVAGFGERLAVAGQRPVLKTLAVTLFWSTGAYAAYPFIAPYLQKAAALQQSGISAVVTLWGVSAAIGVMIGGWLNDRFGSTRVIVPSLALLAGAFLILWATAQFLSPSQALLPILIGVAVWGITVWSFFPAQMARLIAAGGAKVASVSLSLNTSVMYGGFALGSALSAAILARGSVSGIELLAAGSEIIGLLLFATIGRLPGNDGGI